MTRQSSTVRCVTAVFESGWRTRCSGSSEAVLCVLSQPLRESSGRRCRPAVRLVLPKLEKLEPLIDVGPRRLRDAGGDCIHACTAWLFWAHRTRCADVTVHIKCMQRAHMICMRLTMHVSCTGLSYIHTGTASPLMACLHARPEAARVRTVKAPSISRRDRR